MFKSFQQKYHKVTAPNEQYLVFIKRGTKIENTKEERILESINFLLPLKYSDLYYELMHTYYINEKSDSSNYSISAF
jgi:hypothetical protein